MAGAGCVADNAGNQTAVAGQKDAEVHVLLTSVAGAGRWVYLYRAIDQFGQVIDFVAPRNGIWRPPADSSPGHWSLGRAQQR